MQAASCSREGEYCRLIRVSVIIVGYVRFRLKLNLEAILESKASFLQKICSGHQNERIASRLCQPKFVKKLDCRLFISCNILIRPATHVAGKFVFWASFTISLKLQIHPRQVYPAYEQQTYSCPVGQSQPSIQNSSVSIRGQQRHSRSKVSRRLLKANQESLSPSLFWRKLKNLKALFTLILQTKLTSWAQRDTTSAKKNHIHGLDENRLVFQILRHFEKKNKGPKRLVEP